MERYEPNRGGPLPRLQDAQHLSGVVAKIEAAEPLAYVSDPYLADQ